MRNAGAADDNGWRNLVVTTSHKMVNSDGACELAAKKDMS